MKIPRADTISGSAALRKPTTVMIYHDRYTAGETTGGLSVLFTMLCIVDLFGVFPVVALPKTIISCGECRPADARRGDGLPRPRLSTRRTFLLLYFADDGGNRIISLQGGLLRGDRLWSKRRLYVRSYIY